MEIPERPSWMAASACHGVGADLFYPEHGGATKEAEALCAECPVRTPCLAYALSAPELHGYWGGTSERKRVRIRSAAGMRIQRRSPGDGAEAGYDARTQEAVGW